ncbi:MAG: TonB-dependent receptor [Pseudomonadota bacterium]
MLTQPRNFARQTWAVTIALALFILSAAVTVQAEQSEFKATNQILSIDLNYASLGESIFAISQAFGIPILSSSSLVEDKQAPALKGEFSLKQALDALLLDTELTYIMTERGVVIKTKLKDLSPPVTEQSDQDDSVVRNVEVIRVTGTKRNLTVQETQTSVSVITADDIQNQQLFNVEDILLRTPNVSTFGQSSLAGLSVRGIQLGGVGFAGEGQTSQVYVDSAPVSEVALGGASNLWDIAQVEILRGPLSTIQGRNALAGAIVINTADPEYDFGAAGLAIFGNQDLQQFSGMVTGPIVEDQVAFRIAADYREADYGIRDIVRDRSARVEEALTLRSKLLIEPTSLEGLRVELISNYIDTKNGSVNGIVPPDPVDPAAANFSIFGEQTFGDFNRLIDTEVRSFTVDTSYDLSDSWTLIVIGTYEDTQSVLDLGIGSDGESEAEVHSGEVRAAFDYDRFSGWFGAYYFDQHRSTDSIFTFSPLLVGLPVVPEDSILAATSSTANDTENVAVFFDLSYDITERLSLNIGARYDDESIVFNNSSSTVSIPETCIIAPFIPGLGGLPCTFIVPNNTEPTREADYSAFLPRASIKYDLDEFRSVSFTIARGYRAGGAFVFTPSSNPGITEVRTFDPEFVTNYEFALRSEWPQLANLVFNANAFYTDWTDQQVRILASGTVLDDETLNAGESSLYGLEASAQITIRKGLDVFASIGVLETEFEDFPFAATGPFQNLVGNEFPAAPRFTAATGFVYEADNGFFASANAAYTSSQFSDVTNLEENETDSFLLVNGRIGYNFGSIEVSLFADNLFDERVATRINTARVNSATGLIEPLVGTSQTFNVNDPRTFGIELRAIY